MQCYTNSMNRDFELKINHIKNDNKIELSENQF